MNFWHFLLEIVALLSAAVLLGALCERLKQSALIGYLLAGLALGPGGFGVMDAHAVEPMAELGAALLLFSIGLEFSLERLKSLGRIAVGGGFFQVMLTGLLFFTAAAFAGLEVRQSVAIGAMLALSSTVCVLRLLAERAEMETIRGRTCLGILLFQDAALVPLAFLMEALGKGGGVDKVVFDLGKALVYAVVLLGAFHVVLRRALPILLRSSEFARNRELPILLAIAAALGSTWGAHALGLSPALGAFVAGALLAESPFAAQMRADAGSLRVLFATIFFAAIGMMAQVAWLPRWAFVLPVAVAAIIVVKTFAVWLVGRAFGLRHRSALGAGLCLSQVGEFSFVLARSAREDKLLSDPIFEVFLLSTFATLMLTPFLVKMSKPAGLKFEALLGRLGLLKDEENGDGKDASGAHELRGHAIVVGFGPAGRAAMEGLRAKGLPVAVIEMSERGTKLAKQAGAEHAILGDATHQEILEHAHIESAKVLVVTLPGPESARDVLLRAKAMAPRTLLAVRGRYNLYADSLREAGAVVLVDEEEQVGRLLAREIDSFLSKGHAAPPEDTPAEPKA